MSDDPRCCGSGACIVDPSGRCWCGQQWDGQAMCRPALVPRSDPGQDGERVEARSDAVQPDAAGSR